MEGAFAAPGAINNGLYSLNAYDYSLNHSEDTFDFGLLEAFNNDYDNQFNNTFEGTYNTQFNNTSEGTCNDQFSGAYEVQGPGPDTSATDIAPSFDLSVPEPTFNFDILDLGHRNDATTSPAVYFTKRNYVKPDMTYHEALRRGDILLCLPRNVRDVIYTQLLNDIPELGYIEVPQILDVPFPPFASFSDLWYTEACQLMIERATFSLTTDCALFNLIVFFNEFEQPESYEKATALEFTNLSLFEKSDLGFSANSTKLLRQCPNLKRITLIVDLNDVKWTFKRGGREINIDAMLEKYDLEALTRLGDIEVVAFQFQPSMSLGKQLMKMEAERLGAKHKTGLEFPGPGSFWGLKEWLETKALGNMRILGVVCQDPFKV